MKRIFTIATRGALATALTLFIGCGEDGILSEVEDDEEEEQASQNDQSFSGSKGQIAQGVPQSARRDLHGLWATGCLEESYDDSSGDEEQVTVTETTEESLALQDQDTEESEFDEELAEESESDQEKEYYIQEIEFRNGLRFNRKMFTDAECTQPFMELEMHGSYLIGMENADVEGARDINLTLLAGFMTIHDEGMVGNFNEFGACGKSDWAAGEQVELTGLECEGMELAEFGEENLDIYRIVDDQLYMGDESDIPEGERPTTLSDEATGTRQ